MGMGENAIKRLFDKLKRLTGINIYPHLLRHTFATHLLQQGVPLANVSMFLGHADIQSTLPYVHAATCHYREGIRKLPYFK
jgi:integrase/recombinase XerD